MTGPLGTVSIDGLQLRFRRGAPVYDGQGVEWPLTGMTGWDGPEIRTARSERPPGQRGSFRGQAAEAERIITLRFLAVMPDESMGPAMWRRLSAMCSNTETLYPLTVDDPWFGALTADVERDDKPLLEWLTPSVIDYSAQFAAPDPRLYGPWVVRETPLPTFVEGGADAAAGLDATAPGLSAGMVANPGTVRVPNDGTVEASPVLELVGPATTPQVVVQETGQTLDLGLELTAGQTLWINTGTFPALGIPARGVLLDGTSTRRRHLTIFGGWPVVRSGEVLTFAYRAASYDPTAVLRVHARDGWW